MSLCLPTKLSTRPRPSSFALPPLIARWKIASALANTAALARCGGFARSSLLPCVLLLQRDRGHDPERCASEIFRKTQERKPASWRRASQRSCCARMLSSSGRTRQRLSSMSSSAVSASANRVSTVVRMKKEVCESETAGSRGGSRRSRNVSRGAASAWRSLSGVAASTLTPLSRTVPAADRPQRRCAAPQS
eukprot:3932872-Rhodomonas_salina.3